MQRFVSMRSSSSVDLDSSSLDDMRAEWAAIALSVGLTPDRRRRTAGRPSWQQLWERALQEHILHHHAAYSGRTGGAQEAPSPACSHMRKSLTSALLVLLPHPLRPLHSLKTSPAAARQNAAKSTSIPSCATGSSTCPATGRQNGTGAYRSAWVRSGACVPGCSTGSTRTLRTAGNAARHEQHRLA